MRGVSRGEVSFLLWVSIRLLLAYGLAVASPRRGSMGTDAFKFFLFSYYLIGGSVRFMVSMDRAGYKQN